MRVLFTSPIIEHPAAGGPQLRIENSIKALSTVCDLHVISRAEGSLADRARAEEFLKSYCSSYLQLPRLERRTPGGVLASGVARVARRLLDSDTPSDAAFIVDYADRIGADVIWFGYGNISHSLMKRIRAMRPLLRLVCDTDSVWSRFVLRELPYARGWRKIRIGRAGKRKEREEREWTNFCDATTAVSEIDADYYRGLTPHKTRVHVFRNVIDVDSYASVPAAPEGFRNPSIYLAGTFGHVHSAMDTAARWVIDEVLPILLATVPELHFYIVGNRSDSGFGHLNGATITATGRLDSVLPYLCNADVALVPLKFESGTRFKILEAGACGIPLVSTTLGAEGIPVQDGTHILIADEPQAFAAAVLKLLTDKAYARRIAAGCNELVRQEFSVDALAREAQGILAHLRSGARVAKSSA